MKTVAGGAFKEPVPLIILIVAHLQVFQLLFSFIRIKRVAEVALFDTSGRLAYKTLTTNAMKHTSDILPF